MRRSTSCRRARSPSAMSAPTPRRSASTPTPPAARFRTESPSRTTTLARAGRRAARDAIRGCARCRDARRRRGRWRSSAGTSPQHVMASARAPRRRRVGARRAAALATPTRPVGTSVAAGAAAGAARGDRARALRDARPAVGAGSAAAIQPPRRLTPPTGDAVRRRRAPIYGARRRRRGALIIQAQASRSRSWSAAPTARSTSPASSRPARPIAVPALAGLTRRGLQPRAAPTSMSRTASPRACSPAAARRRCPATAAWLPPRAAAPPNVSRTGLGRAPDRLS